MATKAVPPDTRSARVDSTEMTMGVDADAAGPASAVGIAIRSPVAAVTAKVNRCRRRSLSLICIASRPLASADGRLYPGDAWNRTAVTLARDGRLCRRRSSFLQLGGG